MATIPQLIAQRQNVLSQSWQTFLQDPPTYSIAEIIERENAQLKADFVPWAPGIVIASDYLLRIAGHRPTSRRPPKWHKHRRWGYFIKGYLVVRKRGEFWFVETAESDVLVFIYGSLPICTRTYQEAMRLAEHFAVRSQYTYGHLPGPSNGVRWVCSKPDGILDC
jgi:hypothetical protein